MNWWVIKIKVLIMGSGGIGNIKHILTELRMREQLKESQEKMEVIFSDDIQNEKDIMIWIEEAKELFFNAENILTDKLEDVAELLEECFDLRTEYLNKELQVYEFKRTHKILKTQYVKKVDVKTRNRLRG